MCRLIEMDPFYLGDLQEEGKHANILSFILGSVDNKRRTSDIGQFVSGVPCFKCTRNVEFGWAKPEKQ